MRGRGGPRPGAGRPATGKTTNRVVVELRREEINYLTAEGRRRALKSRSEVTRQIIREHWIMTTRSDARYISSQSHLAVFRAWAGEDRNSMNMDMGGWADGDGDAFAEAIRSELEYGSGSPDGEIKIELGLAGLALEIGELLPDEGPRGLTAEAREEDGESFVSLGDDWATAHLDYDEAAKLLAKLLALSSRGAYTGEEVWELVPDNCVV
jgi:hypothetical protein